MSSSKVIHNEKKLKFNYGETALQNAKKTLENLKMSHDSELFLSLQHKINSEFNKFRTSNSFYLKDSRINRNVEKVIEKRKLARKIMQSLNNEKFQRHYELYTVQNKMKNDKIRRYEKDYIKKEQKAILIKEKEIIKRKKKSNEFPKEIIILRLEQINDEEKKKIMKLKIKIKRKDLFLSNFNKEKDKLCKLKKIVNDDIYKEKIYKIKDFLYEKNKIIEDKRKEIEKRNLEIEKFLYEKELINHQKININDCYSNKYLNYKRKIDYLLH